MSYEWSITYFHELQTLNKIIVEIASLPTYILIRACQFIIDKDSISG